MNLFKKKKDQQPNKETPQEKQKKVVTIPIEETEEYKQNNCIG